MRLPVLLARLILASSALAEDSVDLRVLSFNIWYGGVQVSQHHLIAILKQSDADIIGRQEPDGQTAALAAASGYPCVDLRRHIISRVPLFEPRLVPDGGSFVLRGFLPGDAVWGVRIVPRGGDPATGIITSVEGLTQPGTARSAFPPLPAMASRR